MQKITLDIDGMKCSMCESHVSDAIRKALPEASKVKVSASKNEATFLLDDDKSPDEAVSGVEKEGYRVLHIYAEPYTKKKFLFF